MVRWWMTDPQNTRPKGRLPMDKIIHLDGTELKRELKELVRGGVEETLTYTSFPVEHWSRIRTNNGIERIMLGIRRRTRVVGAFPDGNSALMLVCARLRHAAASNWGEKRYLVMDKLRDIEANCAKNY